MWDRLHRVVLDQLSEADVLDWKRAGIDAVSVRAERGRVDPGAIGRSGLLPQAEMRAAADKTITTTARTVSDRVMNTGAILVEALDLGQDLRRAGDTEVRRRRLRSEVSLPARRVARRDLELSGSTALVV